MDKQKNRRKADRSGLEGLEGKFERLDFDFQQKIKTKIDDLPDKKKLTDELREDYFQILDQFEETLNQTYFDSEQVDFYYQQRKKMLEENKNPSVIVKIVLSLLLFGFSLYLVVADLPRSIEGPILIYLNYHDGIALSDVVAIILFGLSIYIFIKQLTLITEKS